MCVCVCVCDEGEVLLPDAGYLSQPQHHEVHPGECWRKAADQTALIQKDHGAQTEQGAFMPLQCPHTHILQLSVLQHAFPKCIHINRNK